jgi:hypothetical protein
MLLFYFEQFVAAARATLDFIIIAGLSFYNTRYLKPVRQGGKKKDPG